MVGPEERGREGSYRPMVRDGKEEGLGWGGGNTAASSVCDVVDKRPVLGAAAPA